MSFFCWPSVEGERDGCFDRQLKLNSTPYGGDLDETITFFICFLSFLFIYLFFFFF